MDFMTLERIEALESKPDPGVTCNQCDNGRVIDREKWGRGGTGWITCPKCNGSKRIYPGLTSGGVEV